MINDIQKREEQVSAVVVVTSTSAPFKTGLAIGTAVRYC